MRDYREIDTVQASNTEIVIAELTLGKGKRLLTMAPRRSYYDEANKTQRLYIPKYSSVEFSSIHELQDLIATLVEASEQVFAKGSLT